MLEDDLRVLRDAHRVLKRQRDDCNDLLNKLTREVNELKRRRKKAKRPETLRRVWEKENDLSDRKPELMHQKLHLNRALYHLGKLIPELDETQ